MVLGKKPDKSSNAAATLNEKKRQEISQYLRNTDRLIKDGSLNLAKTELEKVRAIDPNNAYALAFVERIAAIEKTQKVQSQGPIKSEIPTAIQSSTTEEQLRSEISQKLEEEYKEKFTLHIKEAEQRVAQIIAEYEKKLDNERNKLLLQVKQERENYKQELERNFQLKLQDELRKAEERIRQQLEIEYKNAELEIRNQIQAKYNEQIKELQASIENERRVFAEKEAQSIEMMRKQLETEHAKRLMSELEKIKLSSSAQEARVRVKIEEEVRMRFQKDLESKLATERATIEKRYRDLQKELDKSFQLRTQLAIAEREHAFKERLKEVQENEKKQFEQKRAELQSELKRQYEQKLQSILEQERIKLENEIQQRLRAEREAIERERAMLIEKEQSKLDLLRQKMKTEIEEEVNKRLIEAKMEIAKKYEYRMKLLGVHVPGSKKERLEFYKNRLHTVWASGTLDLEKAKMLMELQEILEISFEEHIQCETDTRLQLYAEAVENAILNGKINPTMSGALDELKQRFDISIEESAKLEPFILSTFQRATAKETIMVVDDAVELVVMLQQTLEEHGYNVLAFNSLARAMEFIDTSNKSVDLILSDIKFPGEKNDGFTFFKYVQQKPQFKKIPFILMSSLDEGVFIKTGVQLGVDDYLTKPLDFGLLLAVIEGKLKKYKALRSG